MIKCLNKNCIYQRGDNVCRLEMITLDEYGGCWNFIPANTCGKCAKHSTSKCAFYGTTAFEIIGEDDEYCGEEHFEPMITFVNPEKDGEHNEADC